MTYTRREAALSVKVICIISYVLVNICIIVAIVILAAGSPCVSVLHTLYSHIIHVLLLSILCSKLYLCSDHELLISIVESLNHLTFSIRIIVLAHKKGLPYVCLLHREVSCEIGILI